MAGFGNHVLSRQEVIVDRSNTNVKDGMPFKLEFLTIKYKY